MSNKAYWGGKVAIGTRTLVARTCHTCGLILGAKHYQKKQRSWSATCNSCFSRHSREMWREASAQHATEYVDQAKTLSTATRRGQVYTLADLDLITEALELGMTYAEIAVLIDRTYYSVGQTVSRFGLKNSWPTREQWLITFDDKSASHIPQS